MVARDTRKPAGGPVARGGRIRRDGARGTAGAGSARRYRGVAHARAATRVETGIAREAARSPVAGRNRVRGHRARRATRGDAARRDRRVARARACAGVVSGVARKTARSAIAGRNRVRGRGARGAARRRPACRDRGVAHACRSAHVIARCAQRAGPCPVADHRGAARRTARRGRPGGTPVRRVTDAIGLACAVRDGAVGRTVTAESTRRLATASGRVGPVVTLLAGLHRGVSARAGSDGGAAQRRRAERTGTGVCAWHRGRVDRHVRRRVRRVGRVHDLTAKVGGDHVPCSIQGGRVDGAIRHVTEHAVQVRTRRTLARSTADGPCEERGRKQRGDTDPSTWGHGSFL